MKWNDEQFDAINSRGQNLLVSAAAGSGKTAVLTERVAQLKAGGTDLDRMLIITFTNAAAAEMRERILKADGASVLEKYHISTFNKFAAEIYRSYYHVAGLPPGLAICDEYKQQILKDEAMDEMFEELFDSGDQGFKDLLTRYCSARSNDTLKEMIDNIFTFIQSMPDPQEWLDKVKEKALGLRKVHVTQVTPSFVRVTGAGFNVSDCAVTEKSSDARPYRRDTDWKYRTCASVDFCFCARRVTVPLPEKPVTCANGP